MIVICDGMPRSGSTWAFNVCLRLIRLRWPAANVYCGFRRFIGAYLDEIRPEHDHAILKTHLLQASGMALSLTGGVRNIYTYRDPYDAVFSFVEMFNSKFEAALEGLRWGLVTGAFHRHYGNALMMPYHQLRRAPKRSIREIGDYLGLAPTPHDVSLIHGEMAFEKMKKWSSNIGHDTGRHVAIRDTAYDPSTSFFRNHVRDGRSGNGRRLTPDQRRLVRDVLKRHGH